MQVTAHFTIKVIPNAKVNRLEAWQDEILKVSLKARPIEGEANDQLRRFLSRLLGIPLESVVIKIGKHARTKGVRLEGISRDEALAKMLGEIRPLS
jgi:uncharacterized protein YggU (UPF0235/DUF167 family)